MTTIEITEQLEKSFFDYALSTIEDRALPALEDGLKPVQRRILYTLYRLGLTNDKPHRKSARVVGEALGRYHPHADKALYDALVLLSQDFKTRYPLLDGHGNFGSIDNDPPAAMRYTECRMSKVAHSYFEDIEIVDYKDNFDQSTQEPVLLPSLLPMILANGSNGIAVGMVSNILPHNMTELLKAIIFLLENKDATLVEILNIIKGPDLPTGGRIYAEDMYQTYLTGQGTFVIQSKMHIEGNNIIITEIPYQLDKTKLLIKLAEIINSKKIANITNLVDESDKDGIRIVIELTDKMYVKQVIQELFKKTKLQTTYSYKSLMLNKGRVVQYGLLDVLREYILYTKLIHTKRIKKQYKDLKVVQNRLKVILLAINNIDQVIKIIRKSKSTKQAIDALREKLNITIEDARIILDIKLSKLLQTEVQDIEKQIDNNAKLIEDYELLLTDKTAFEQYLKTEYKSLILKHKSHRRTVVVANIEDLNCFTKEKIYRFDKAGDMIDSCDNGIPVTMSDKVLIALSDGNIRVLTGRDLLDEIKFDHPIVYFDKYNQQNLLVANKEGMFAYVKSLEKDFVTLQGGNDWVIDSDKKELLIISYLGYVLRIDKDEIRLTNPNVKGVKGIELVDNDYLVDVIPCDEFDIVDAKLRGVNRSLQVNTIAKRKRAKKGVLL